MDSLLKKLFGDLFDSKRFKVALFAVLLIGANEKFNLGIDPENLDKILLALGVYVGGQTMSDMTKYLGVDKTKVELSE